MKILSSFTHSNVVTFFLLWSTKEEVLKNISSFSSTDPHNESQEALMLFGQKKESLTGLDQHGREYNEGKVEILSIFL